MAKFISAEAGVVHLPANCYRAAAAGRGAQVSAHQPCRAVPCGAERAASARRDLRRRNPARSGRLFSSAHGRSHIVREL